MKRKNIYVDNMPLVQAKEKWLAALTAAGILSPLPPETIPVAEALARVTATAIHARHSSPFYHAAAMDGIAVRFAGTIGASEATPVRLTAGQYVSVNTGNAMPSGFDAVIMVEDLQPLDNGEVEIIAATTPWQHVRTIGEDIVTTELILPENHLIRPIDQGAMLATGVNEIPVRRRPSALIIPTGSELISPGEALQPGKVIEFNSHILAGYLKEWRAEVSRGPIVRDDPEILKQAIINGVASHDLVIINAGASVGTKDFTAQVLGELGEIIVHGVNIKPGKPVILAIVNNRPVIGLPGYPVSAVITLRLFVQELVYRLLGLEPEQPEVIAASLSRPLSSKLGVEDFVRVKLGRVGDHLMATPAGRGAGAVMTLVEADGILTVPAGSEGIGAGEKVIVELLRDISEVNNTLVFIGSHDNILDVLANLLHLERPVCRLSSAHVGSMGGIMAIKRGEAHVAGAHLLDEQTGEYNISYLKRYLAGTPLLLINLAFREQGLLTLKGNPKNILGFADLTRKDIRFINRQKGAGTRLLTDLHLKNLGIAPAQVQGYDHEEYTHMNIASAVATGAADTGLAIRAAAQALGLDFTPVAQERYDLIIPKAFADDQKIKALLRIIRENDEFRKIVSALGGYDLVDSGRIMYEQ